MITVPTHKHQDCINLLLCRYIDVHFAVVVLTPFKISTMDLDIDYYSSRCKDRDGLYSRFAYISCCAVILMSILQWSF
jgi:hypothetical protein